MSDEENIDGLHQKIRTWLSTRVNLGAESTGFIPMHSDEAFKAVVDHMAYLESKVVVDPVAYLESRVDQLREAIAALPKYGYWSRQDGPQAETANAARAAARKAAGLED